jgi:hypothetical protein
LPHRTSWRTATPSPTDISTEAKQALAERRALFASWPLTKKDRQSGGSAVYSLISMP